MTPAINLLLKSKIAHQVLQYEHDAQAESFGLEAAQKLSLAANVVFKTLVVKLDTQTLCVAILPVERMLSMKLLAKAVGAKKAQMADKAEVERVTGYVLGGVSPLGQKKRLMTIIDTSARELQTFYVSAGKRGLEIALTPDDLASILNARFAAICQ
ncbi:Cys-tRNA(Pro) deacylase [Paraglaciecola polaris]|uniref:Cys-tRNA(Pro)/Cys-tRNA(Cys) deacylase n=1 Tax=Paraglaciecola polaris LMG 21857 TaxID=1129793 RepID=K6ZTR2_9ALTE|nr:Cys-tRNA(Pro) deacylase [Paraglaciecola polaris]GAC32213.1 Cys-tRNA(Pro)/Cys-tRNA(Cys) deacylase ybaK [Paraglaciecola polaris LMG 21857]|tara:strand:+ start:674 stop:1141 length:468 start_codon:yes stop_codon:yes gene_type:complete